jgi:ABC-2 type transport system ATP-binding protein
VPLNGTVPTLKALLTTLDEHGIELDDLTIHTPDLDDVFFAVTESRR